METRSLEQIARDCAGSVHGNHGMTLVRRVCTDSRTVTSGDLFVALKGERHDGHDFLAEVAERGAAAALIDSAYTGCFPVLPAVVVDDTRHALGRLARAYRNAFDPCMIAVGGSNGKTSAKEMIAAVARERFPTLSSKASFNNDIGVPLTLLRLEREHEIAVLEVGTNHPGELEPLVRWIRPKIGVLTSLGREHLQFFGDMEGVCQEEGILAELLPEDGILYLGADNEWGESIVRRTRAAVVRVGCSETCDWRATNVRLSLEGTAFQVISPVADFHGEYQVRLAGRHHAVNALFAIAIGAQLGLTRVEIQRGLDAAESAPHRMRLQRCGEYQMLDDCYNANADSMAAALHTLAELPCRGRRIAVLGDMAELGEHAESAHADVGRLAATLNLEQLLVVGKMAATLGAAARQAGLHRVLEFESVEALSDALRKIVGPGDLVLLKASRCMQLERVVAGLCDCNWGEVHRCSTT